MPYGDKTGPEGKGPKTGRGFGKSKGNPMGQGIGEPRNNSSKSNFSFFQSIGKGRNRQK